MKRSGFKQRGKPMRRKASNPKSQPKSATGQMLEPWRLAEVRRMNCAACGCGAPVDPHHCKDRPPFADLGVYRYFPGYKEQSADADAIPLCRACHTLYHADHGEYARRYGPDYQHIKNTRKALEHLL